MDDSAFFRRSSTFRSLIVDGMAIMMCIHPPIGQFCGHLVVDRVICPPNTLLRGGMAILVCVCPRIGLICGLVAVFMCVCPAKLLFCGQKKRSPKLRTVEWEQRESNPRPSACKADALNQLSYAPEKELSFLSKGIANIRSFSDSANFIFKSCRPQH